MKEIGGMTKELVMVDLLVNIISLNMFSVNKCSNTIHRYILYIFIVLRFSSCYSFPFSFKKSFDNVL